MASVQERSLLGVQSSLAVGSMDSWGASKQAQHIEGTSRRSRNFAADPDSTFLTSKRLHDSNTKRLLSDSIASASSVSQVSPSKRIQNQSRHSLPPPRQTTHSSRNMSHRNNRFRTRRFLHRSTNPQTPPQSQSRHVRIAPCPVRSCSVRRRP